MGLGGLGPGSGPGGIGLCGVTCKRIAALVSVTRGGLGNGGLGGLGRGGLGPGGGPGGTGPGGVVCKTMMGLA
jgi:hypothetical protein